MSKAADDDYHGEYEMCGLYAGGVLGGLTVGVFGDLLHTEYHTMLIYVIGVLCGAVGGFIAGKIFHRTVV